MIEMNTNGEPFFTPATLDGVYPAIEYAMHWMDRRPVNVQAYLDAKQAMTTGDINQISKLKTDLGLLFASRQGGEEYVASDAIEESVSHTVGSSLGIVEDSEVASLMPQDYVMEFLIDVSDSMSGERIRNVLCGLVAKLEALDKIGIKTIVRAFNNDLFPLKEADEALEDARGHIGAIVNMTDYSTDLGWATYEAAKELAQRPEKIKALTVLTDGGANGSKRPSMDSAKDAIGRDKVTQGVLLLGEGIGSGVEAVGTCFNNYTLIPDIAKFAEIDGNATLNLLMNPDRF